MLWLPAAEPRGSIGGGAVEHAALKAAPRILEPGITELLEFSLTVDLAMCCGGKMTLFMEPIMGHPTLIVLGCGHVGSAVARTATPLGFDLITVDDLVENACKLSDERVSNVLSIFRVGIIHSTRDSAN